MTEASQTTTDEITILRAAMNDIAEGRGRCATCGKAAEGAGGGIVVCDAAARCTWSPVDPSWIADKARNGAYWADEVRNG